jgi:UMF1 family MFS transporter
MTKLTPLEIKTEFFGFYALFDKTSTLLGPLTFGLVSWLSGSQKIAVLSVGVFFVLGFALLKTVKEKSAEIE